MREYDALEPGHGAGGIFRRATIVPVSGDADVNLGST